MSFCSRLHPCISPILSFGHISGRFACRLESQGSFGLSFGTIRVVVPVVWSPRGCFWLLFGHIQVVVLVVRTHKSCLVRYFDTTMPDIQLFAQAYGILGGHALFDFAFDLSRTERIFSMLLSMCVL